MDDDAEVADLAAVCQGPGEMSGAVAPCKATCAGRYHESVVYPLVDHPFDGALHVAEIEHHALLIQLAAQHDVGNQVPNIEISAVDWHGDRTLTLCQHVTNRRTLHAEEATAVMRHVEKLWGFPVTLEQECDGTNEIAWGVVQGELAFGTAGEAVAAFGSMK